MAGLAGGLARRFGLDPTLVRIAIVILAVSGGTGIALYVIGWLVIPRGDQPTSIAQRALHDPRTPALALGFGTVVVVALLVLRTLGLWVIGGVLWPVALAVTGLGIIWRHGDDDDHEAFRRIAVHLPSLSQLGVRSRRMAVVRTVLGVLLVTAGAAGLVTASGAVGALRQGLGAAAAIIAGCLLVFGPFWLRLVNELGDERRERVRSQERADIAAHIHDSVLQTLALIQRRAGDEREVTRLARAQERDLRAWLFGGRAPGAASGGGDPATFAAAVSELEYEVESAHGVAVEAVTVGDCPLDDDLIAVVAAGREAAVNAAKWSGAPAVLVFAEVEKNRVSLFVRDRGKGFDPTVVAPDRRGIAESINGRMARHHGDVMLRSRLGEGTEVELTMPRRDGRS